MYRELISRDKDIRAIQRKFSAEPAGPIQGEPAYAPVLQRLASGAMNSADPLLGREAPNPTIKSMMLNLQRHAGNKAVQSLLSPAEGSRGHHQKGCSCGGTCPACRQKKQAQKAMREAQAQLFRGVKRPEAHEIYMPPGGLRRVMRAPLESEAEDLDMLAGRRLLRSACGSTGELPDELKRASASPGDQHVHQGPATVVCDGAGDYRVEMGGWASATCGIPDCVRLHEESHIEDLKKRYPDGCKNADGTPKPDGTSHPTGGAGYSDWLKKSECKAYSTEIPCEEALLSGSSASCRPTLQDMVDDSKRQKKKFCGC